MRPQFCPDSIPTILGIFDPSIAPPLLWYAYVPVLILTLLLGVLGVYSNRADRNSLLLLGVALSLFGLVLVTFLQWIAAPVAIVMFAWQIWPLTVALLFLFMALFVHSFLFGTSMPSTPFVTLLLLYLPVPLFLPTALNISAFDIGVCQGVLHPFLINYLYAYCLIIIVGTIWYGVRAYLRPDPNKLSSGQALLFVAGVVSLLGIFLATTIWGDVIDDYRVEIIGPLGMLVFLVVMSYISVSSRHFDLKLIGTELLVIGLAAVVGSMIFVSQLSYLRYVAAASLVAVILLGWFLAKGVRREIRQRREIESLMKRLETANLRLKQLDRRKSEFVSIASHQLRSPLAAIIGYASMLLDGSYGKLGAKATEAVERIALSSKMMAEAVEDYLNVSRIEAGTMKFHTTDFNLKNEAEKVADDLRGEALKKGVVLLFRTDLKGRGVVNADLGKVQQIIHNLINNSIKYTPKGTITVLVRDDPAKKDIVVDILDTGIGMSRETLTTIFQKFERGGNADGVNVRGTGLGLYTAQKLAEGMGGRIEAFSEGEGRGSRFVFHLPMMM